MEMLQIGLLWGIEIAPSTGSEMNSAGTILELPILQMCLWTLMPKLTLSLAAKIYRREIYTMSQEGQKQGLSC